MVFPQQIVRNFSCGCFR